MSGAVLHIQLQSAARADPWHRWRFQHEHECIIELRELLAQISENAGGGQPQRNALLERLQRHEDHAGVGRVGKGAAIEAGERHRILHAWPRQDDLRGVTDDRIGACQ